jgi:HPt (histidine-containing phosphotransfer) domain-containing protein
MNTDVKNSTPGRSSSSILDEEMIDQLRDLGVLEEITRSFLDEGPRFIGELRTAIHRGDATALFRAAHTLKGVSAATGAKRVTAGSRQLEELGKAGVLDGTEELVAQLERDFQELVPAFEEAWTCSI